MANLVKYLCGLFFGICVTVTSAQGFNLKLLHINDHHSHIQSEGAELMLNGQEVDVEIGGFPRVSSKIKELSAASDNVIKLHAGDAITGTLFFTLFEGESDAELMNEVCFDAFALGNHEFDRGDSGLKSFLDHLAKGDCDTKVLAANVVPQIGTPLAQNSQYEYIKPLMVKRYSVLSNKEKKELIKKRNQQLRRYKNVHLTLRNYIRHQYKEIRKRNPRRANAILKQLRRKVVYARNAYKKANRELRVNIRRYERVAVIGLDIANKTKNSSSPDATTQFLDERETAQRYIDLLRNYGIEKIILLTHYQYQNDIKLAQNLTGVDVIVGGDSHTLLGTFDKYGLNSNGDYPTVVNNLDGDPVCVVQAWQYSAVVGELDITFNQDGTVSSCKGTPHLLLADTFEVNDTQLAGQELQDVLDFIDASPELSIVEPDPDSQAIVDKYSDEVIVLNETVIGSASEDLCFERIPGQGRSQICDVSETISNGSDISNVVALAFKEQSIEADISIQNAGGVRTDIAQGDITIGDAYTMLPFANTLVNLDMTGEEIVNVLEEAIAFAIDPDGSTGAYPYASGLRYNVDLSQAEGNRVSNVEVKLKSDTTWSPINPAQNYKVVTNNFISAGRDGYVTFGQVTADGRAEDTFLDYAQSFVDYVRRVGVVQKLPVSEYSTQSFTNENGITQ